MLGKLKTMAAELFNNKVNEEMHKDAWRFVRDLPDNKTGKLLEDLGGRARNCMTAICRFTTRYITRLFSMGEMVIHHPQTGYCRT